MRRERTQYTGSGTVDSHILLLAHPLIAKERVSQEVSNKDAAAEATPK
jgi:hypothetical protein